MIMQEDRLIEHWNAIKNIRLVCNREVTPERVESELLKLGLSEDRDKPVRDYSGGMRRRVALLRALLAKGDLVIMDEPFRGLDAGLKKQVIEYIKENTLGKTVIIVTHEKEDVKLLQANLLNMK
jgi:NitT/TauT family transport system ATP-binding protein